MTLKELKQKALDTVSADHFYDVSNIIDDMDEQALKDIIDCGGDYDKELEL